MITAKPAMELASHSTMSSLRAMPRQLSRRAQYLSSSPRHELTFSATSARTPLLYQPNHKSPNASPSKGRPRTSCAFSTSSRQHAVLLNPRADDAGKPMDLEITPRAATRLAHLMRTEANPSLALRVSVESGGCHGFQYLMSLTNMQSIDRDEDTVIVYDGAFEDGTASPLSENAGADAHDVPKVVLDAPSLELLTGSQVDFTRELIGSQFKITGNPRASSSCGCGTSFDVKFD